MDDHLAASKLAKWVSKSITYYSKDLTESGYIPRSPEIVLQKGWGDCKDMSLLLVRLLEVIRVEAHMTILNTELSGDFQTKVAGWFYDHCIVWVKTSEGEFAVDCTQGHLSNVFAPNGVLGRSLLVLDKENPQYRVVRDSAPFCNCFKSEIEVSLPEDHEDHDTEVALKFSVSGPLADRYLAVLKSEKDRVLEMMREMITTEVGREWNYSVVRENLSTNQGAIHYEGKFKSQDLIQKVTIQTAPDETEVDDRFYYYPNFFYDVMVNYFGMTVRSQPLIIPPEKWDLKLKVKVAELDPRYEAYPFTSGLNLPQIKAKISGKPKKWGYEIQSTYKLEFGKIEVPDYENYLKKANEFVKVAGLFYSINQYKSWSWWIEATINYLGSVPFFL